MWKNSSKKRTKSNTFALSKLPEETQKKLHYAVGPIKIRSIYHIFKIYGEFSGKVTLMEIVRMKNWHYLKKNPTFLPLLPHKNQSVEGFGFVYLEASAYGIPIIANRTGGVEDAVLDKKTGLLSEPKDLENLTKNFHTLILDENYRKMLGKMESDGQVPTVGETQLKNYTQVFKGHRQKPGVSD